MWQRVNQDSLTPLLTSKPRMWFGITGMTMDQENNLAAPVWKKKKQAYSLTALILQMNQEYGYATPVWRIKLETMVWQHMYRCTSESGVCLAAPVCQVNQESG